MGLALFAFYVIAAENKKVDEDMKQSSKFVEYVYSDTFLKDLDNAYKKEIEKRNFLTYKRYLSSLEKQ